MENKMYVSAFIPAKMISRRLPAKNMKSFNGKPLLHYSIRAAQETSSITSIIVSSDHPVPLDFARAYDGVTALQRPGNLAGHDTLIPEVMAFHYGAMETPPDIVVLLQPTHPLRIPSELDKGIRTFCESDFDCMFSVAEEDVLLGMCRDNQFFPEFPVPRNKREEPRRFKNTGNFYLFRPERTFLTKHPFGLSYGAYQLGSAELEVDIDYPEQFILAEHILRAYPEQFKEICS